MTASLSGQFQVQGSQALKGATAWVEDTNSGGGLYVTELGRRLPLHLTSYDDQSSAQKVRQLTQHLIVDERVDLLLGPYSSGLALAAAEVAEGLTRVLWNHGGSADGIYSHGYRWVVGVLSPASRYLAGVVDLVREADPNASRLAIVRSATGSFSASVSDGVKASAAEWGFDVVYEGLFRSPATDFSSLLREVREAEPHVLVGVGRIQDDLLLAEQMNVRVTRAAALVATPIEQFKNRLGTKVNGFIGPSQWEASAILSPEYGPSAATVVSRLASLSSGAIDYPMAQAYAAGLVAQRCVEEAGSLDNHRLRQVAATLDFSTFYGRFRIDPTSGLQVGHSVLLVQWQQGEKVVVWPREMRQAPLVYPIGAG